MNAVTEEFAKLLLDGEIALNTHWSFVWHFIHDDGDEPDSERYITVMVECRMCEHRHLSSHPIDVLDETCLQCSNCEHMTCEPMTDDVVTIEQTYEPRGGPAN